MTDFADAISLEISGNDTVATLRVSPGVEVSECDREAVLAYLSERHIQLQPETGDAIDELLAAVRAAPDKPHSGVIARGRPARHGEPGRLQWEPGFDPEQQKGETAPEAAEGSAGGGDACHYARSAFIFVTRGTRIARLLEPTPGEDGQTVTGKTIAARDGKPANIKIDASLRVEDDGAVVAAESGAIFFRTGELKVISHLEIPEFVDFSTGNIDFDGDVTVHKGVRDCFTVKATKDLRIRGMVEAADAAAGRDARLEGGVAGREKGRVYVERDLHARYLDSATVVVGRHLSVDKEIVNVDLSVGGRLAAPSGALIGGEAFIGGAAELAEVGSPAGLETTVFLGVMRDFDLLKSQLGDLAATVDQLHAKASEQFEMLTANASKLTASQAEQMTELQFSLETLTSLKGKMSEADERIVATVAKHTDAELTVHRLINAGVVIRIGEYEASFREPIKGPVRITLGSTGRPLVIDLVNESQRELREVAKVVKQDAAEPASPGRRGEKAA